MLRRAEFPICYNLDVPKHRHKNIVAVYLVLQKNNQVLLLQRQNTGYEDGNYGLISGHVEPTESFRQAMIREAKEEANISLTADDLEFAHLQHRSSDWDDSERVDVYFLAKKWEGNLNNNEPQKCVSLDWFPMDNLPKNIIDCVGLALKQIALGNNYSEFGWSKSESPTCDL